MAICRTAPDLDELIIFMDGHNVFGHGTIWKTLAIVDAEPELQALATDEEMIVYGSDWMRRWLDLCFAQRRLTMQGRMVSDKFLTLTGRMSVFRARNNCCEGVIRTIKPDHLEHWLWGTSGRQGSEGSE